MSLRASSAWVLDYEKGLAMYVSCYLIYCKLDAARTPLVAVMVVVYDHKKRS